jgi:hypothetical protein
VTGKWWEQVDIVHEGVPLFPAPDARPRIAGRPADRVLMVLNDYLCLGAVFSRDPLDRHGTMFSYKVRWSLHARRDL